MVVVAVLGKINWMLSPGSEDGEAEDSGVTQADPLESPSYLWHFARARDGGHQARSAPNEEGRVRRRILLPDIGRG